MDWDEWASAAVLFPSFTGKEDGEVPALPSTGPAWTVLNPGADDGLKGQMRRLGRGAESGHGLSEGVHARGTDIIVHPTAVIEAGASLVGPCYIGPRATVRSGAYVREFSWICADAVVGHATEVKHSILLPGAKAPHFNYVGDSILGKGVNLGAGTKLSNLRNDGGEVHLRLNGERIPSGLRKFGALLGEGAALGCNSVTNPGVVLGCNSTVWPNVTVTGVHGANSQHR
jgi:NDP-sugar pyrophosphorylase family protein